MRFFVVLVMFALLPLQFSAVAAADCCGHVALSKAPPTQHHQPFHLPVAQSEQDLANDTLGFDLDCGTCHANCAAALMATTETTAVRAAVEQGEHLARCILPPWHEQPYRPQWFTSQGSGLNAFA
jgi:hypothetical protein